MRLDRFGFHGLQLQSKIPFVPPLELRFLVEFDLAGWPRHLQFKTSSGVGRRGPAERLVVRPLQCRLLRMLKCVLGRDLLRPTLARLLDGLQFRIDERPLLAELQPPRRELLRRSLLRRRGPLLEPLRQAQPLPQRRARDLMCRAGRRVQLVPERELALLERRFKIAGQARMLTEFG